MSYSVSRFDGIMPAAPKNSAAFLRSRFYTLNVRLLGVLLILASLLLLLAGRVACPTV